MFERYREMSQQRQLGLAALAMVIFAALLIAGWMLLREPYRPLFTDLRPPDAAAIVDELDHRKTPYRLADSGTAILVPADRVDATRLALMNGGLALKGTVGFELFNKSDMGVTDFAQRINYQRALQGELERTIMSLDGVEESRVHLSLGEDRVFREDRVAPKASITIHMRAGVRLTPGAVAGIQRLVAAAVPQLDAADVVILDETGQIISAVAGPAPSAQPPETAEQNAIGTFYVARIREALERVYPASAVAVDVHAGLGQRTTSDSQGDVDWNPSARNFPLQVVLDPEPTLDNTARQDIQGLAAGAIDFDASRGDAINFGTVARSEAAIPAPAIDTPARKTQPDTAKVGRPIDGVAMPLLLSSVAIFAALLAATLLVFSRRGFGRSLSAAERDRLAVRLRMLLEQEGSDGAALS